ncbi:MAG: protocatechuate 3,4-dioxygenase subunit alpha [Actinobacteria bacterium]|nr:protocatechuate 3,4-dioxygenase subunit alpha [Actinomycetota bacterium]
MTSRLPTPSQTVGPFFHDCFLREPMDVLVTDQTPGERIRVEGRVYDGAGEPIDDAAIEIWQADDAGRYRHPADLMTSATDDGFLGFGRSATDETGAYWFETIKPGRVGRNPEDAQSPHLSLHVFARGLLDSLVTRLYFGDEDNSLDAVLKRVPEGRRSTVIATPSERDGRRVYVFDIVLQGDNETVFFCTR